MSQELTGRQREALDFVKSYIERRGYPPTIAELASGLQLAGKSTAYELLRRLEAKGYIEVHHSPRALRVLG